MKIFTENKVYVQKNDIAYLNQTDLPIPASIFMKVFGQGVVIIDDRNRYEFMEFTKSEEIDFFKKLDWIIDYNEVKELTEDELMALGQSIAERSNMIAKKYNAMTQKEREKNQNMIFEHELLEFKMHSLKDIILFKRGDLKIKLPKDVSKPIIEISSDTPQSTERKNNGPRLFRSIFNRRKRK